MTSSSSFCRICRHNTNSAVCFSYASCVILKTELRTMRIAVHGPSDKRHIITGNEATFTVKQLKRKISQEQRLKKDSFGLVHGGVDIIRDVNPETRLKDLLCGYELNESVDLYLSIYQIDSVVIYLSDVKYHKRLCQKVKPHCTCKEIANLIFDLNLTLAKPTDDLEVFLFNDNGQVWKLNPLTSMKTILGQIQGEESFKLTFFFTEDGHLRIWIGNSLYLEHGSNLKKD